MTDLESSDLKLRDCHLSKLTQRDTLPVFFCLLSHSSSLRFQLFAPSNLWTGLSGRNSPTSLPSLSSPPLPCRPRYHHDFWQWQQWVPRPWQPQ